MSVIAKAQKITHAKIAAFTEFNADHMQRSRK